jgi:endoglucanase
MKQSVFIFLCIFAININAQTLKEFSPITSSVFMLKISEGTLKHRKAGQKITDDQITRFPLNIEKAIDQKSYSIVSDTDQDYKVAQNPISIARKAKTENLAWVCDSWGGSSVGCVNNRPDHLLEHTIYLFLPKPLKEGQKYTINFGNILKQQETLSFEFATSKLRSETIHINQLGYDPNSNKKFGYLSQWLGDKSGLDLKDFAGQKFHLADSATRQIVFSSTIKLRKNANAVETGQSGDTPNANFAGTDVYECDFSNFKTPGSYVLVVDNMGCSFPFKIATDAYYEAYYWAMKSLYQNRSGIEIKPPYTNYTRPADHNPKLTPGFSNRLKYTSFRNVDFSSGDGSTSDKSKIEAAAKGNLTDTYGWYHDAGDWDGYFTHSDVPLWLMLLYEADRDKHLDGELTIPESGNGIPDLLDESAWLLRFFQRLRAETIAKGFATGGASGARVFGDLWGADLPNDIAAGSWQDTQRDWYVLGEDPYISYKYAAMAANFQYILASENLKDSSPVDWKKEAIDTFAWAQKNSKKDELQANGGRLGQIRLFALASLYRLTGVSFFNEKFVDEMTPYLDKDISQSAELQAAAMIYATLMPKNRQVSTNISNGLKTALVRAASENSSSVEQRSGRWAGNFFFPLLIGQATTPFILPNLGGYTAKKLDNDTSAEQELEIIRTTSDYFLGANPLNICYVTGVGERPPIGIFHLDSWLLMPENTPVKGFTPYGPFRVSGISKNDVGPWAPWFSYRNYYPAVEKWPGHEMWGEQRTTPLIGEFTIHQNSIKTAVAYGILGAKKQKKEIVEVAAESKCPESICEVLLNNEPIVEVSIVVYPNPTTGSIYIKSDKDWKSIAATAVLANGAIVNGLDLKRLNKNEFLIQLEPNFAKNFTLLLKMQTANGKEVYHKSAILFK